MRLSEQLLEIVSVFMEASRNFARNFAMDQDTFIIHINSRIASKTLESKFSFSGLMTKILIGLPQIFGNTVFFRVKIGKENSK
jgi:hypothetical protein